MTLHEEATAAFLCPLAPAPSVQHPRSKLKAAGRAMVSSKRWAAAFCTRAALCAAALLSDGARICTEARWCRRCLEQPTAAAAAATLWRPPPPLPPPWPPPHPPFRCRRTAGQEAAVHRHGAGGRQGGCRLCAHGEDKDGWPSWRLLFGDADRYPAAPSPHYAQWAWRHQHPTGSCARPPTLRRCTRCKTRPTRVCAAGWLREVRGRETLLCRRCACHVRGVRRCWQLRFATN